VGEGQETLDERVHRAGGRGAEGDGV
jgi:hypothetical protein